MKWGASRAVYAVYGRACTLYSICRAAGDIIQYWLGCKHVAISSEMMKDMNIEKCNMQFLLEIVHFPIGVVCLNYRNGQQRNVFRQHLFI